LIDKKDNIRRIQQGAPRTVPPDGDSTFSLPQALVTIALSYHPLASLGPGLPLRVTMRLP